MNLEIALLLAQDGIANGAIYVLVGLGIVLVFVVTRVIFEGNEVRFDVRDDGTGFDSARRPDGHGLAGIQERVEEMGGQLAVRTAVGAGTTIMVHLPRAT